MEVEFENVPKWNRLRSHSGRKRLRNSIESNETQFVVPDSENRKGMRVKSRHDLQLHPSSIARYLRRAPLLGAGAFSEARTLETKEGWEIAVGLMTPYETAFLGSMNSPYFGVNASAIISEILWHAISEPSYSPHIITPWFNCVGFGTARRHEKHGVYSMIQFTERAYYGTVRSYIGDMGSIGPEEMDEFVRVILFQITFTLDAIYQVLPRFRHNDLRDANVLLQLGGHLGTYTLYRTRNAEWYMPNVGISALISDFDTSTIPGVHDNYITLEQEFSMPLVHCNTFKDHSADLFIFASSVYALVHTRITPQFKKDLQRIWNGKLGTSMNNENKLRPPNIHEIQRMPSACDVLLRSHLFESYTQIQSDTHTCFEQYSVPFPCPVMKKPPKSCYRATLGPKESESFTLYVPIFKSYANERNVPYLEAAHHCMVYQRDNIPLHSSIGTYPMGIAITYRSVEKRYTPRFIERLDQLWRNQGWGPPLVAHEDVDTIGRLVVDETVILGARFINVCAVPTWWWAAIFIMAYRDTLTLRNLRRPEGSDKGCSWILEHYAEWWLNMTNNVPISDWVVYDSSEIRNRATQLLHVAQQWSWWRGQF